MKKLAKLGGLVAAAMIVSGPLLADEMKSVAISTIVEVPSLLDTKQGIIDGLAERGFVEGKNITIDYQNANGNMSTQQQIAKKFVGDNHDVIVPLTTPTAQAVASATKDIPIVFTVVTDPIKAKLVESFEPSGTNITGVSDEAPLGLQLDLIKEIVPNIKRLGFIYNPGLDNSLSTLEAIKKLAVERDIEIVASAAPTTNEVSVATKKLIGEVQAIYLPNDTTVVGAIDGIVKIGQDVDLPIFTGETGGVTRGALASVGLDYLAVGKVTGHMAADVLEGKKAGDIPSVLAFDVVTDFKTVINQGAAKRMGVTFPESVLKRATETIE